MGSSYSDSDEPLTPAGRLFIRPEINQVIHCTIGVRNPIDVDSVESQVIKSFLLSNPRFSSLLVRHQNGVEHWRRTSVDINRHIVIVNDPVSTEGIDDESAINEYLADLSTSHPLDTSKPLWEIHLLVAHKCAIFRIHHALGDGISLVSMLMACCRRVDDPNALPSIVTVANRKRENRGERRKEVWWKVLFEFLKMVWFSLAFLLEFVLRALWLSDRKTKISGGEGVELWPRKLAVARFLLEDMKVVKNAIPNATINDVLFGVISSGLSRYLNHRSPNELPQGLQMTGVSMVNLREQPGLQDLSNMMSGNSGSRWGNKIGMVLLPVNYHKGGATADPLQYLKRAKVMIDRKKNSLEAHFSYRIGHFVMSWFGPKAASLLNYRIICNTSFTISNVVGPQEEIAIGGNPIAYLRGTSTSLPHALTMHMVSYAGKVDLQILVAKDIIPDPEFLADCFEKALIEMKEAAATVDKL